MRNRSYRTGQTGGWVLLLLLGWWVTACSSPTSTPETTISTPLASVPDETPGEETPEEAAKKLFSAITDRDWDRAVSATHQESWALVALAEGIPPGQLGQMSVADLFQVGRNFWTSFAGNLPQDEAIDWSRIEVTNTRRFDAEGLRYAEVTIRPTGSRRAHRLVLSEDPSGWKTEVVVSFAESLIPQITQELDRWSNQPNQDYGAAWPKLREGTYALPAVLFLDPLTPELQQATIMAINHLSG